MPLPAAADKGTLGSVAGSRLDRRARNSSGCTRTTPSVFVDSAKGHLEMGKQVGGRVYRQPGAHFRTDQSGDRDGKDPYGRARLQNAKGQEH
jgi:hypothetical protein